MVKFEEHLEEIRETQRQIQATDSAMRKRDLNRRLKKLQSEYDRAMYYYSKRMEDER